MLHAVIHGKSSRWLKEIKKEFSVQPVSYHQRIPREDEITSTIFGVMKYLDSKDIYRFFRLLSRQDIPDGIQSADHEIIFWSSKQHKWENKSIKRTEPDIVVSFCIDGKKETYIIEIKWGANSHFMEDQLEREWENFQEGETFLIYLASTIHPDFYIKKKNFPWYATTWLQFLEIVSAECNKTVSEKYSAYMRDLKLFFNQLNIKQFDNFYILKIPSNLGLENTEFRILNFNNFNIIPLNIEWSI